MVIYQSKVLYNHSGLFPSGHLPLCPRHDWFIRCMYLLLSECSWKQEALTMVDSSTWHTCSCLINIRNQAARMCFVVNQASVQILSMQQGLLCLSFIDILLLNLSSVSKCVERDLRCIVPARGAQSQSILHLWLDVEHPRLWQGIRSLCDCARQEEVCSGITGCNSRARGWMLG